MLCSKVLVGEQDPVKVYDEDLVKITNGMAALAKLNIDTDRLITTSQVLRIKSQALFREGLGCTLAGKNGITELQQQVVPDVPKVSLDSNIPWPLGAGGAVAQAGFDYGSLNSAADYHFTEHGDFQIKTSSLAVSWQGRLIYERYADNVDQDTPIYGFSLGKTMAALFVGSLVQQGVFDVNAPLDLPEWQQDARQNINAHHLLTMTSGLQWSETYDKPTSDANQLFIEEDMGRFAAAKPLVNTPGTNFNYSSGSTMILSMALKQVLGGSLASTHQRLHENLFRPLDINSAVVQADTSGSLVFGMQDLIGTQDLARLGQFLLQNGKWRGQQVIPTNWVEYMSTPVNLPTNFGFDYGVGLWLNTAGNGRPFLPSLPADTLIGYGLRGQFLIVVPSLELVIVRTGNTLDMETLGLIPEVDALAATVIEALPL
jgi:CubicO group peptidase (beta-lactamase class C family)